MATFRLSSPKKKSFFNSSRESDAHLLSLSLSSSFLYIYENGPLMLEWLETGGTVNANRFCDTLRKLKIAIKDRRRGLLSKGVILLQDNAHPHVAKVCNDLMQHFRWEVLHHPPPPPPSPRLPPSAIHVLRRLEKGLEG